MGTLDQITQMKQQGMQEQDIINYLQTQGISPNEIQNVLNQSKIKDAVSAEEQMQQAPQQMEQYTGAAQEIPQENYQEEYYPQTNQYPPGAEYGGDNSSEIAEQVFVSKMKPFEKQLSDLQEFKTINESKIQNIDDRLKRMEGIIDRLQIEILKEVGKYGTGLDSIKKEMGMMQDSFTKMISGKAKKKTK